MNMKKSLITIAVPAEDVEYVESIRMYNVKIHDHPKELLIEMKDIADKTENEGLRQAVEQIAKNRGIKL